MFTIFCIFGALNGNNFWPSEWSPLAIYLYISTNLLLILLYLALLSNFGVINADSWLRRTTNLDAYVNMTEFDSIMAHYTNVATVGLFLGILIYSGRGFADTCPNMLALGATLLIFVIFGLYAILFARLVYRFAKEKSLPIWAYLGLSIAIFVVDSIAIQMFIDAVPAISTADIINDAETTL